jgi:hypothetical protein
VLANQSACPRLPPLCALLLWWVVMHIEVAKPLHPNRSDDDTVPGNIDWINVVLIMNSMSMNRFW